MEDSYYVYALKDLRTSPAKPFYIGKGTGVRAWEHGANVDSTRKGKRIQEIKDDGHDVVVLSWRMVFQKCDLPHIIVPLVELEFSGNWLAP